MQAGQQVQEAEVEDPLPYFQLGAGLFIGKPRLTQTTIFFIFVL
jgi:hypothetical protein